MTTIDATKKLTIRHFAKFEPYLDNSNFELSIDENAIPEKLSKADFIVLFKNGILASNEFDDEQVIKFATTDAELLMTFKDYKKWTNEWWANRIFAAKAKAAPTKPAIMLECFIAKRKLDTLKIYDEVSLRSENKKDILAFINEMNGKYSVQCRVENSEVVFLLRHVDSEDNIFRNFDELLLTNKISIA